MREWTDHPPNLLPETEHTWVLVEEAAEKTGVTVEQIRAGIDAGKIDAVDLNPEEWPGAWLVTVADVVSFSQGDGE